MRAMNMSTWFNRVYCCSLIHKEPLNHSLTWTIILHNHTCILPQICMVIHLLLLPLLLVLVLVFVCAAIFVLHLFLLLVSVFFVRGVPVIARGLKNKILNLGDFSIIIYYRKHCSNQVVCFVHFKEAVHLRRFWKHTPYLLPCLDFSRSLSFLWSLCLYSLSLYLSLCLWESVKKTVSHS